MVWKVGVINTLWIALLFVTPGHAQNGRQNLDETVLFRWLSKEDRFTQVAPHEVQPKNLYLRWDNREQRYVWVTGDNRHMILSKSKVQGGRIGHAGQNARNWFVYNELDYPPWKKNTERTRPEVWRWDPTRVVGGSWTTGTYVSERAAVGWESWGGELDPISVPLPPIVEPPVKPPVTPPTNELSCTIQGPTSAMLGSSVVLTMTTTGPVKSAMLNGAAVDFPLVMRMWTVEKDLVSTSTPDKITIVGSVRGERNLSADCRLEVRITR